MIKKKITIVLILLIPLLWACSVPIATEHAVAPPVAEKIPHVLSLHGDTRIDHYYWMRLSDEQKVSKNHDEQTAMVMAYLNAENEYAKSVMSHTERLQDELYHEMLGRIKQDDDSAPYFKNGYWYYTRYEEGKEYPIYCRKKEVLDAPEEILLNVNELAKGHSYFNVVGLNVSPDNKILAYGVDTVSRRVYNIRFKNLETGQTLPDRLLNTSGESAWASDNKTLFYTTRNKVTLLTEKIYRHQLGQPSSQDQLVYEEKDPAYYIGVYRSKSGEYIIIWNRSTMSDDYHILPANQPTGNFKRFTQRLEDHKYNIEHYRDRFYIRTNWNAENFRLMEARETSTGRSDWREVIPHRADVLLQGIELFDGWLVRSERSNGLTQLVVRNIFDGVEHNVDLDEPAYAVSLAANPEFDAAHVRFLYSSLTTPWTTIDYHMDTREQIVRKQEEVVGGHNPEEYVTERLFAPARDGKKIPVTVVYKKNFEKNGQNPLLLFGYGSYGAIRDPSFNSTRLSLLDRGFAFAIAHVRGSQMLGRSWYEDGKMMNKKNTFYDFIDCAKYLIDNKYTNPEKLFAMGGSAGGLLMGAVANMAPELFKGMVAQVPFVDVLTTMSDPSIPLTTNEYDEWGNPEIREHYDYIKTYSPYDNVRVQEYPNLLITTGLFDSQVQYWEPAKWTAKLREHHRGSKKILLVTNMEVGHGGASGRFQRLREIALVYAFLIDLAASTPLSNQ
jgi:oligopeptidase B